MNGKQDAKDAECKISRMKSIQLLYKNTKTTNTYQQKLTTFIVQ